jgi:hypothetical protein
MKTLCITLFSLISLLSLGQDGIYNTYEDYTRGNLNDLGKVKKVGHILKKSFVIFEKNNETKTVKLKKANVWGYKNGKYIGRVNDKGLVFYIDNKKTKIILYYRYCFVVYAPVEAFNAPLMSLGLNGEMVTVNKKNFIKFFKTINDDVWLEKAKKMKPGYSSSMKFIESYLKEHSKK